MVFTKDTEGSSHHGWSQTCNSNLYSDLCMKLTRLAEILTVLFVGSEFWQGLPNVFSWELNISKLLVVEEVGGANFHGFIFLGPREDEFFVNFKLGNHKDNWKQEFKQT